MTQRIAHADAVADPAARERLQRRTLRVVVASQVLGGAGLAAGITVGSLLATELLGSERFGGVPSMLFTLGAALSAFVVGRIAQRWGRRIGLGLGFLTGGVGAIAVVLSAAVGSVWLLLASLFVYGAGTSTNLQARYAGTDLAPPARRATAVSVAMVSTTLGAVAGPNLVAPLGALADGMGLPRYAGPFLLAAVAFLGAGAVLFALLRPDPYLVAREIADREHEREREAAAARSDAPAERPRVGFGAVVGAAVMVLSQITMVAIMTMTPVHMEHFGHGLGPVGLVIGLHIGAMYLPSLVTGRLVDRVGRIPMAVASGATLLVSGALAAIAPGDSLTLLIVALVLLGVGWNFGLIAGTALVVDATVPENRPKTQGTIEVLISLAGATGGGASGLIMAGWSYEALGVVGGVLALLIVPIVLWARWSGRVREVRAG
ncbi:MAG: MFS transporter [Microbacteriaceae bacterium]|nr:MFS transporter [Microbacteriaceae bacterium]